MTSTSLKDLQEKIREAGLVIDHSSFPDRFSSPAAAELVREIFEPLAHFVRREELSSYDESVRGSRPAENPNSRLSLILDTGWLSGEGFTDTIRALGQIIETAYGNRLSGRFVSIFRSAVSLLIEDIAAHIRRSALPDTGVLDLVEQFQILLGQVHRHELDRLLQEAADGVESITRKDGIADRTLGAIGDKGLASHYGELANREARDARNFRWLTVFLALVAGALALAFVVGPGIGLHWLGIERDDYVHLIQRGLLIAGVFGLAGYFAKQAHQHRSMANWAGSLAVQLKTFDAYLAPVENQEIRDDLRKSFSARVFGDHPAMKGEPTVAPTAAMGEKAMDLATRVIGGTGK